jgi:hypothetical protein
VISQNLRRPQGERQWARALVYAERPETLSVQATEDAFLQALQEGASGTRTRDLRRDSPPPSRRRDRAPTPRNGRRSSDGTSTVVPGSSASAGPPRTARSSSSGRQAARGVRSRSPRAPGCAQPTVAVMGTSVRMIEKHDGTLLESAHAGIATRLAALEAKLEQGAEAEAGGLGHYWGTARIDRSGLPAGRMRAARAMAVRCHSDPKATRPKRNPPRRQPALRARIRHDRSFAGASPPGRRGRVSAPP